MSGVSNMKFDAQGVLGATTPADANRVLTRRVEAQANLNTGTQNRNWRPSAKERSAERAYSVSSNSATAAAAGNTPPRKGALLRSRRTPPSEQILVHSSRPAWLERSHDARSHAEAELRIIFKLKATITPRGT